MPQRAYQAASPRVRVRRLPERGRYDSEAIDAVLDAGLVAHLGFVTEGPVSYTHLTLPTNREV